jgi:hypothetical protein
MALGDSYATAAELKSRVGISDSTDDTRLTEALASVSREIERYCGRQFNKTTSASARIFYPDHPYLVTVDDFHTTTDLAIKTDHGNDGTYETTWTSSDYQLGPLNGVVDGEQGWPYFEIRAVLGLCFPTYSRRAPVQVTAQWGWNAVPAPVKEACLIMAVDTFKLADAPWGVAGYGEYGPVRVRDNPVAVAKLRPYRRHAILVG